MDAVGESYHLIDLCPQHHRMADGADAYESGLLIDGYVTSGLYGPVYTGSDPYLLERYGAVDLPEVQEDLPSEITGQTVRGQA